MRRFLVLLATVLAVATVVATASSAPPLRLTVHTDTAFNPLDAGTVQAQLWDTDSYRLRGAVPNTSFWVGIFWWIDNTACYGPPTQSLTTATLTTNNKGDVHARYAYTGSVPTSWAGHLVGVEWIISRTGGPVAYWTDCITLDFR